MCIRETRHQILSTAHLPHDLPELTEVSDDAFSFTSGQLQRAGGRSVPAGTSTVSLRLSASDCRRLSSVQVAVLAHCLLERRRMESINSSSISSETRDDEVKCVAVHCLQGLTDNSDGSGPVCVLALYDSRLVPSRSPTERAQQSSSSSRSPSSKRRAVQQQQRPKEDGFHMWAQMLTFDGMDSWMSFAGVTATSTITGAITGTAAAAEQRVSSMGSPSSEGALCHAVAAAAEFSDVLFSCGAVLAEQTHRQRSADFR